MAMDVGWPCLQQRRERDEKMTNKLPNNACLYVSLMAATLQCTDR